MEKNLLNLSYGFNIILLLKIKQVNLSFFFGFCSWFTVFLYSVSFLYRWEKVRVRHK